MQNKKDKKENKMKTKQGRIRLTEQELHYLVEDAVRSYLINEGMDEAFTGGAVSFGKRLYNKLRGNGEQQEPQGQPQQQQPQGQPQQQQPQGQPQQQQPQGNIFNRVASKLDNLGNSFTRGSKTFEMGSANQDAQKAIKNAVNALNSLKDASERLQKAGAKGITGKPLMAINNALAYLQNKSASGIGYLFSGAAEAAETGGTFQNW
jgi:hypothetical protein